MWLNLYTEQQQQNPTIVERIVQGARKTYGLKPFNNKL